MFKKYAAALVQSLYSPRLYREVLERWQGVGILYTMLVSALTSLFAVATLMGSFYVFGERELPHILRQMPEMRLENGFLTTNVPQPVMIASRNQQFAVLINTDATLREMNDEDSAVAKSFNNMSAPLGFGKDFVAIKKRGGVEFKPLKNSFDKPVIINREAILELWPILRWAPALLWPFLIFGQMLGYFINAVLVAVFSYGVTAFMKEEYPFDVRLRLAAVALTPPTIISLVLLVTIGHQTLIWFTWLVALLYIYVMMMAIRQLPRDAA